MVQRHADARAMGPARFQRPPAQRDVADVVDEEEGRDRDPTGPEPNGREGQPREERQPAGPHQAVAERSKRPAQGFTQTLDLVGSRAIVLGTCRGADRQPDHIWMGIEEMAAARHRRAILGRVEITEQRLFGDADAHAQHALVVVRALHREQPEQRARQRASSAGAVHRSHSVATRPPPRPAANHARLGPRPTSRSVPAAPAASAVATAATASSTAPRTVIALARSGRASQASTSPTTVTSAARSASRSNPPTCTRTNALGSPDSSCVAAAWTIRELTRRSKLIVRPPIKPVTRPTSAPRPRPSTPAEACAVATAATVAGPYSG